MQRQSEPIRLDYCRNRWCHKPLEYKTDDFGRLVELPCQWCARFKAGRCYACNLPLRPGIDVHHTGSPSRWHMRVKGVTVGTTCYELRQRGSRIDSCRKHYRKNASSERARSRKVYAKDRKDTLAFKKKRYAAKHKREAAKRKRDYSTLKIRPCPVLIAGVPCGNPIEYYSKPAKCCDRCWWKVAEGTLQVPKERKVKRSREDAA